MKKTITVCDWCKDRISTNVGNVVLQGKSYDVCDTCVSELINVFELSQEQATTPTAEETKEAIEVFAAEKPKRGRKKKEQKEERSAEVSIAKQFNLDMRDDDHALICQEAIETNEPEKYIEDALENCAFSEKNKAFLQELLELKGFDFSKEEDRLRAFEIKHQVISDGVLCKDLKNYIDENVTSLEDMLPF